MYSDLPFVVSMLFIAVGLFALAWSSDKFVFGAAALARILGVSPFVVGMVIVGFGTSAPELLVSMFAGLSGHTNLSLGNAYGSCVFNIAAILGVSALIRPLVVKPAISFVSVPILSALVVGSYFLLKDGCLSRANAVILLVAFAVVMPLYCKFDKPDKKDASRNEGKEDLPAAAADTTMLQAAAWTVVGLVVMVGASHALVWGAVDMARALGVGELLIGLTIVAVGTSVPELASAVAASRRNEAELVLGNIVGSNIFNMLAVVGIAGTISPSDAFSPYVLSRDLPVLLAMTLAIAVFGINFRRPRENGVVSRGRGAIWLVAFLAYMALTIWQEALKNG